MTTLRKNETIESFSENWSKHLLENHGCDITVDPHSVDGHHADLVKHKYGENIAILRGYNNNKEIYASSINGWAGEGWNNNFGNGMNCKNPRSTNNSGECAHYTTMNWKGLDEIGCGIAKNDTCSIVTCNYRNSNPDPGNSIVGNISSVPNSGQYATNVVCQEPLSIN